MRIFLNYGDAGSHHGGAGCRKNHSSSTVGSMFSDELMIGRTKTNFRSRVIFV